MTGILTSIKTAIIYVLQNLILIGLMLSANVLITDIIITCACADMQQGDLISCYMCTYFVFETISLNFRYEDRMLAPPSLNINWALLTWIPYLDHLLDRHSYNIDKCSNFFYGWSKITQTWSAIQASSLREVFCDRLLSFKFSFRFTT